MRCMPGECAGCEVRVKGGSPAKLKLDLAADKLDSTREVLNVTVLDSNGNRLAGQQVTVTVTGGKADDDEGMTDENGRFSTGVAWNNQSDIRSAEASCGILQLRPNPELANLQTFQLRR